MKKAIIVIFVIALAALTGCGRPKDAMDNAVREKTMKAMLADYFLYKAFPLDEHTSGFSGEIELWLDKNYKTYKNPGVVYDPKNPPPRDLKEFEPKNAILLVVDEKGKKLDILHLKKPHATLSVVYLYGNDKPTYVLEEDFTAESGVYNGPISRFVEISKGQIGFLRANVNIPDKILKMKLMRSVKSEWKIVPSRYQKGKDILLASSHPEFVNNEFNEVTNYRRYYFNGKEWLCNERTIEGGLEFESESDFPEENKFP